VAFRKLYSEENRSQLVSKGTNEIVLDAYTRYNPSSMAVAIDFLQKPNKIITLGDMFELGDESQKRTC
jgi:UDP-N-acetylmuramoyl-tripeptide--D-alanyl-D-alanine ligase